MKCVICDAETKKCVNVSYSRTGPEDEPQRGSGKVYACGQHFELVKDMSIRELELFMRPYARPAPLPPVKERGETSEAETRFEPQGMQSNGNGLI